MSMLKREDFTTYEEGYRKFRWNIPEYYNIGWDCCDQWADDPKRIALYYEDGDGGATTYTFAQIKELSNKLANVLTNLGIERGDRIGVCLPQRPETGIAHIAIQKLGAIGILISGLFGPDALGYRLENSGAKAIIIEEENKHKLGDYDGNLESLKHIIVVGKAEEGEIDFWEAVGKASSQFTIVKTKAEDPALLTYTSGTTGMPKGALQAARYLLGHFPGIEFAFNFPPQENDVLYAPADWAWVGGLTDLLLAAWHYGIPALGYKPRKFDPEKSFELLEKYQVTCIQYMPTALRMMQNVPNNEKYKLAVRAIWSGGEVVGADLHEWCKERFGVPINEMFGQTEANLVLSNCYLFMLIKPGAMGRPVPGHIVEVIDDDGNVLEPNEIGELAVKRPDPAMFLEYWKNPEATAAKTVKGWHKTADLAMKDEDGYFWYRGRKDDVISSAGYRIGPEEIEATLRRHPAVAEAAVIGSPDKIRGEVVKAFVQLREGFQPSEELKKDIQNTVKSRLAAYEYPREVEFIDKVPMTTTGKITRNVLKKQEYERKQHEVVK